MRRESAHDRVRQWLKAVETNAGMSDLMNNDELLASMNVVLFTLRGGANEELVADMCATVFEMYRADEPGYKECVFQLIPAAVYAYLDALQAHAVTTKRGGACKSLEVFLLGIYNKEVYSEVGTPKPLLKFRFPSLALGSIYHDPSLLQSNMLTDAALRRLETGHCVQLGPFPQVAKLDGENRTSVLSAILYCYSCHMTSYGRAALIIYKSFCITCSSFHQVAPQILLHLISCVYYALYKGCAFSARIAVDAVYKRAMYEILPDVLMATKAVKHAIEASGDAESLSPSSSASLDRHGGIIDITANLARPRGSVTQLGGIKNLITNASFRTKKLPDDIPLQDCSEASLTAISEEKEEAAPKEHKETKLGAAKNLLAHSRDVLAAKAAAQKNKALKIAGKINPSSSSSSSNQQQSAASSGNDSSVSVDGIGIEMSEIHEK
ncbi:unnamed protein product [Notodromas monacha]|uniref:Hyccin n=1 Tax=Notodromas monacha TaxID=399045 RepID=A0A7R9GHN9_9CRUS|nr:unnamed protein product [Notodromas monacha]CAG0923108.1 unnamed protein product [Notodromas monacha]